MEKEKDGGEGDGEDGEDGHAVKRWMYNTDTMCMNAVGAVAIETPLLRVSCLLRGCLCHLGLL